MSLCFYFLSPYLSLYSCVLKERVYLDHACNPSRCGKRQKIDQVFNVSLGYKGVQGQTVILLRKEERRRREVLGKQNKEMRDGK